ncbi:hypothetical protein HY604_04320 [Candidatus Peregrinibacteria bacterium]|nr:hypothetical protein [Candidatus Peregrinibacteria bacterium]
MTTPLKVTLVTGAIIASLATGIAIGNSGNKSPDENDKSYSFDVFNESAENAENTESETKTDTDNEDSTKTDSAKSDSSKVQGTYRCWSFNVNGIGSKCTSPPIVLNTNGTYSMSSEKGTYKISGETITLSESKIRGPGTFKEGRKQIVFNYTYNGSPTTVTYMNYDDKGEIKGDVVSVKLTLIFPENDDRAKWLSSITLNGSTPTEVYDALAQNDGKQTIVAEYRTVETGKKYQITAGAGSILGEIDLTNAKGHTELTVYVDGAEIAKEESLTEKKVEEPAPKPKPKPKPKPAPTPQPTPAPEPAPAPTPEPEPTPEPKPYIAPQPQPDPKPYVAPESEQQPEESSPYAGKPCDPNIPHYSQPGCID